MGLSPLMAFTENAMVGSETDIQSGQDDVVDLESRLGDDQHQSLRLWLRMLSCTTKIENEIRGRLRSTFGVTLPRFDLMAQLERHPEGLRMGDLSRRMMVTGGNVTGITDQLEREGLVERIANPDDRRVFSVRLTGAGRRAFRKMAKVHETWVTEQFSGLGASDKEKLIKLLSELKQQLNR
jgi:DNA-binding MarR family transcriptional regulator